MGIDTVINSIPDFGRDARLNLEAVLTPEGAPGLSREQILGVSLASAYFLEDLGLARALQRTFEKELRPDILTAAKGAATVMAMNTVYYRTLHLAEEKELGKLPAKLRMNFIARPGIPKTDFELMSLALAALAGCSSCINAHIHEAKKAGITLEGIQSTIRISAVINSGHKATVLAEEGGTP